MAVRVELSEAVVNNGLLRLRKGSLKLNEAQYIYPFLLNYVSGTMVHNNGL